VLSATNLVRLVAILSLIVIGVVVLVAVRRGGRQHGARAATRPRR